MTPRIASAEEAAATRPLTEGSVLQLAPFVLAPAAMAAALSILFGQWSATSFWSFPRFLIAVLLLVYAPGKLLVDIATVRLRRLEDLTLSLTLGMMVSSLLYWLTAFFGIPQAFFLWPLTAVAMLAYRRRGRWHELPRASLQTRHLGLIGLIVLSLLPLTVLPMYYRSFSLSGHGTMTFPRGTPDLVLHTSIANELTHSIPPQVPFLAGSSLSYHYAMDLFVAMLSSTAGLSTLDLTARFAPTLWFTLTILSIFSFSRAWLRSHNAALLATFLVVFGEDFSFIPGLLLAPGPLGIWSADFFGVPTSFSLYFNNPMLPGLAALFAGLFCLLKFWEHGRPSSLIITSFIFASIIEYKAFLGIHTLITLGITTFVWCLAFRDVRLLQVFITTTLMTGPLLLHNWLTNKAGPEISLQFHHWPYIPQALLQLQLAHTAWGSSVNALITEGSVTPLGLVALVSIAVPGFVIGSFGLRTIGVPLIMKALAFPSRPVPFRFFAAVFVVVGVVLTMTCTLTPAGLPYNVWYNNSVWFFVQSKYVAWMFVVEAIIVFCRGRNWLSKALVLIVTIGLSVPSTLQFFASLSSIELGVLSENELALVRAVEQGCAGGEVVFSRRMIVAPIVTMTKCRVPFIEEYAPYFVSVSEWRQRQQDQQVFWTAWGSGELRADILDRYKALYLVVDKRPSNPAQLSPSGEGQGTPLGDSGVELQRSFDNDDFALYRVLSGY